MIGSGDFGPGITCLALERDLTRELGEGDIRTRSMTDARLESLRDVQIPPRRGWPSGVRPFHAAVSASMVRSALLATLLKLSPSRRSLLAAVSSISRRSVSSRRRSLAVKSLWLEVMLVQRSFQPPPVPAVRVPSGHVFLALARHLKARLLQGGVTVDLAAGAIRLRPSAC